MAPYRDGPSRDLILLLSRCLLAVLFLVAGWGKLTGFGGASSYFGALGLPFPSAAALFAVVAEIGLGLAILLGVFTQPVALALAAYTLVTALIGHRFWTMSGAAEAGNLIHFNKNLGIMGGFLLLSVAGPGRYAIGGGLERTGIPPAA